MKINFNHWKLRTGEVFLLFILDRSEDSQHLAAWRMILLKIGRLRILVGLVEGMTAPNGLLK